MAATCDIFELTPTPPFRLDLTVWTLRRRPDNIVDRWDGKIYRRLLPLPGELVDVAVTQLGLPDAPRLQVTLHGSALTAATRAAVCSSLERLLGLGIGLEALHQFAASQPQLESLSSRFSGMKPPRFATVFEALINAIACQQVALTLGIRLLNRLAQTCGAAQQRGAEVLHTFPTPENLARSSLAELRQLGFTRQKCDAMIELSQAVVSGELDLEQLSLLPDSAAVKHLCQYRGIGRWSAEYVLLRGLGRTHVFPGDDVGGRNNLERWLGTEKLLDYNSVRDALSSWQGYAGLIYFYLLLDRLVAAGYVEATELN